MTEEQHLRAYTKALKARLPRDHFQPMFRRIFWVPAYLALFIAATWVITKTPTLLYKLLLSLVIAQAFTGLGFVAHEILHGQVTKSRWLRTLSGTVAFMPLCVGARLWRKWHNVEHHGNTQHPDDDPDAMVSLDALTARPALQPFFRMIPVLRSLLTFASFSFWFTYHGYKMLARYWRDFDKRHRPVVVLQAALPIAVWLGLLIAFGPVNWFFVYLLPALITNFTVMSYIATNHYLNPLTKTNDPLLNSLSVTSPRWIEWLHMNFGYHTEHHVFPAVSPVHGPAVATELRALWPERYNSLPHWKALYFLWKTPRLYLDERNLVDLRTGIVFGTLGFGLEERLGGQIVVPGREMAPSTE